MKDDLSVLYDYDHRKFREAAPKNSIHGAPEDQLIAYLTMWSHSLEKALSRDDFELGHGFTELKYIADTLNEYDKHKFNVNRLGYINTISVLHTYIDKHKNTEYEKRLKEIFAERLDIIRTTKSDLGGAFVIDSDTKDNNNKKNFADLSTGRFSVRTFAKKPVSKSDIEEVVRLAIKTPSVCNRQPIRVRVIYDPLIIQQVLDIQQGVSGYPTPPCLLLVTADDTAYLGSNERNQGFVDGGLFSMSLLYALEYKKMAACPLNCMFDEFREKSLRHALNIPDTEKLVMFISCGYFNKQSNVCKSFRYPVEDILSEVSESRTNYEWQKEPDSPCEVERQHQSPQLSRQNAELDLLRKPGVRLSARKFAGAVGRSIHSRLPFKRTIRRVINKFTSGANRVRQYIDSRGRDGAIVTICVYNNFGNILQRFALQKFLSNSGYSFVSYNMLDTEKARGPINHNFLDFARRYIDSIEFNDSTKRLYNKLIVGSDQVWRPEHLSEQKGGLGSFFLDFLEDRQSTRVAYAASFGFSSMSASGYTESDIEQSRELLNKFKAISVREVSAVEIVNRIAKRKLDSKVVLDPTFLIDRSEYDNIIDTSDKSRGEVADVFYFLFDNTPKYRCVEDSINSKYPSSNNSWPDSVEDWLGNIRDSKLVVAGSFHAVVFCIIFHTDFVLIEGDNEPNTRVRNIIGLLGISDDRIINKNNKDKFNLDDLKPIDWDRVDELLNKLKEDSGGWLLKSIRGR